MSAAYILVVDDEADIRSLLKEILSEEGYEVDVAANAVQARASRARQTPGSRPARHLDAKTLTALLCCASGQPRTPTAVRS